MISLAVQIDRATFQHARAAWDRHYRATPPNFRAITLALLLFYSNFSRPRHVLFEQSFEQSGNFPISPPRSSVAARMVSVQPTHWMRGKENEKACQKRSYVAPIV